MLKTHSLTDRRFLTERNLLIIVVAGLLFGVMYLGEVSPSWISEDLNLLSGIISILVTSGILFVMITSPVCLAIAVGILCKSPGEERALWQTIWAATGFCFLYGRHATPFLNFDNLSHWIVRDTLVFSLGIAIGTLILAIMHNTERRLS